VKPPAGIKLTNERIENGRLVAESFKDAQELFASIIRHPAYAELHQLVCELGLVSHASTQRYDGDGSKMTAPAKNEVGGRRPPGDDVERPPRRPREPIEPSEDASDETWREYRVRLAEYAQKLREYHDDRTAWATSYQRRTVHYFDAQLAVCVSVDRLIILRDEARETLQAWRKTPPQPTSVDPPRDSFVWKCQIADDGRPIEAIKATYGISKATVYRYRAAFRGVRASFAVVPS
jgi:hypothetical protein